MLLLATRTLKREKISENGSKNQEFEWDHGLEELGNEAAEKLGYRILKDRNGEEVAAGKVEYAKQRIRQAVIQKLMQAGIDPPFSPESVVRYQRRLERSGTPILIRMGMEGREGCESNNFGLSEMACVLMVFGIIACIVLGIMIITGCGLLSLSSTIAASIAATLFGLTHHFLLVWSYRAPPRWELESLDQYKERIPEFAITTALEVQREFPDSKFFVCSFIPAKHSNASWLQQLLDKYSNPDPFLVARINSENFYLAVWNEPGFERKLEVAK